MTEAASNETSIVPGSVVHLRSGGPLMTVESISGDSATCAWFTPEPYSIFNIPGGTQEQVDDLADKLEHHAAPIVTGYEIHWTQVGCMAQVQRESFALAALDKVEIVTEMPLAPRAEGSQPA